MILGKRRGAPDADIEAEIKRAGRGPPTTKVLEKVSEIDRALQLTKRSKRDYLNRFEIEAQYMEHMDRERDSGRITSMGRLSPALQQGAVVRSVKQSPKAWEERGDRVPDFRRVIPLGGKNCFDIQPGEIAFQLYRRHVPNPKTKQGDTSIVATTTVNGLSPEDKAQFVGITVTANKVSTPDGDNRSTVLVAGLGTVIHTGPHAIPAFATVMMTLNPYKIQTDRDGTMVPAVDEKGQPPDKFRPALVALDERVVSAAQLRLRREVNETINKVEKQILTEAERLGEQGFNNNPVEFNQGGNKRWKYAPPARFNQILEHVELLVNSKLEGGWDSFPQDRPQAAYVAWYGVRQMLHRAASYNLNLPETKLPQLINKYRMQFRESREDREFTEAHASETGELDTSGDSKLQEKLDEKVEATVHLWDEVGEFIDRQIDAATQGYHSLMRLNICGTGLNWVNTGSELDLLAGYGGF